MLGKILIKCCFLLLLLQIPLQAIEVETILNENIIGLNDYSLLQIKVSDSDEIEPLNVPKVKGLDISFAGIVQTVEIVNFKKWSGNVIRYRIEGLKTGSYKIPAIPFLVDGKKYYSKPVKIKVEKFNRRRQNSPFSMFDRFDNMSRRSRRKQRSASDLAIKPIVEIDERSYVTGEPVVLRYFLLTNNEEMVDVKGFKSYPSADGFVLKQLDEEIVQSTIKYNNESFSKNHITTFVMLPTQKGEYVISGGELVIAVELVDSFFGGMQKKVVSYPAKNVVVKSITGKNKPVDYSGNVGSFDIELANTEFNGTVYNEVIIKVIINGYGNFYNISNPVFKSLPGNIKLITKAGKEELKIEKSKVNGSKEYNFSLIPEKPGTFELGALSLNYYDPAQKQYFVKESNPVKLVVTGEVSSQNRVEFADDKETSESSISIVQIVIFSIVFLLLIVIVVIFIIWFERRKYNISVEKPHKKVKKEETIEIDKSELDVLYYKELVDVFYNGSTSQILNKIEQIINYIIKEKVKDRPDKIAELDLILNDLTKFRFGGGEIDRHLIEKLKDDISVYLKK